MTEETGTDMSATEESADTCVKETSDDTCATQDVRRLNSYIKSLIDSAFTYALLLDNDTKVLYYSDSLLRLVGVVDDASFFGMPVLDACNLFHNVDFYEQTSRRLARLKREGRDFFEDDTITWPSGERRIYRISYKRIMDEQNDFDGILIYAQDITDLRLEEGQRRLSDLLTSSALPCLVWDEEGNTVAYNEVSARFFGIPSDLDPVSYERAFRAIEPPYQPDGTKTLELRKSVYTEALEKGFSQVSVQLIKGDGSLVYVMVNVARIAWVFGYRLVIYLYDMTEIMEKEAEAKEAKERIKLMLDATPLCCSYWDEELRLVDCNEEAVRMFKLPNKQVFIDNFSDFSPKYQPNGDLSEKKAFANIKEAFERGSMVFEWMHQDMYGELIPTEVTLVRLRRKDDGEEQDAHAHADYSLLGYVRDLREYKKMMQAQDEANERNRLMLDCSPLMYVMQDDKGNITDCNQAALSIMGVASKEEFCENYYSYFPEFQPDGTPSAELNVSLMRTLEEKGTAFLERTYLTPAGELIPVETSAMRIPWKDTYFNFSFSNDLRERKANEQKMAEITARERKAEIQKEAALAANEAKSQFLANMSHEIRTPMNAVLGMSELLLQENLGKRQLRYVRDINRSAVSLLDIINDILDVSKLQAGKLSLLPVHYDFNMLIDNISSVAQFLVAEKHIAFKLSMDEALPLCLYGDDVRLRQVLLNLLGNAVKFTERGWVKLSVEVGEDTVQIAVSDTGIGIPQENLSTLFDAFEQADQEKNRLKKGTGLGLTITKMIVEMMGGSIAVESTYGEGATFTIEIPKVVGDAALIHQPDEKEPTIHAPGANVLVVDDNTVNLNVAVGILRLFRIDAHTAASGREAIELVEKNDFDLVFMDHRMPGMTGIEATREIRKLGHTMPIVALTASAVIGAKEMMIDAGMDDYLPKPIVRAELNHILKKWIPKEKQEEPPSAFTPGAEDDAEENRELWEKFKKIEGLSLMRGLDRVGNQTAVYEKTLRLMVQEIEKGSQILIEYVSAEDLSTFRIQVHSLKGSLANIGAMELSEKAYELEAASDSDERAYLIASLPEFLEGLFSLNARIKEAFTSTHKVSETAEIPPGLAQIFEELKAAFLTADLVSIESECEKLDELHLSGAMEEELEQIKDAVMMMDYESATEHMQRLLEQ